jgi:hypothetical protein
MNLVAQPSWLQVLRASLPAEGRGGRDAARTCRLEACATGQFMVPVRDEKTSSLSMNRNLGTPTSVGRARVYRRNVVTTMG